MSEPIVAMMREYLQMYRSIPWYYWIGSLVITICLFLAAMTAVGYFFGLPTPAGECGGVLPCY